VYGEEGNCISAATTCSPNWADLSRAEKCAAKRYLTVTTEDLSGGGTHGRTQVRQYTTDEDGNCDLETTCSGSRTDTTTFSAYCSGSESCTQTYNTDCNGTTSGSGSGTVSASLGGGLCCESTVRSDCTSTGQLFWCDLEEGEDKGPFIDNFSCGSFQCPSTSEVSPAVACTVNVTYSEENEQGFCTPKTLPSFPEFYPFGGVAQCEQPTETPELLGGQNQHGVIATPNAYNFIDPYNPVITSKLHLKFRVLQLYPSFTCYTKVWFRNKVQKYKYEDCDSGFAGDPPRTAARTIDCNTAQCYSRWSTDGEPTFVENGTYEWRGSGYPCYAEKDKAFTDCDNIIYGAEKTVIPDENTDVTVEYKYSFVEGYEPDWGDENGCQGCKLNGFPTPNPDDCPVCAP